MAHAPMTVVETDRFLKDAKAMMPDSEREDLVAFLGANPESGEIMPETGVYERFDGGCPAEGNAAALASSTSITPAACHFFCLRLTERTKKPTSPWLSGMR
jgi:hypothetical protein